MSDDVEIKAMSEMAKVLVSLNDEERSRVLQWALSRFQVKVNVEGAGIGKTAYSEGNPSRNTQQQFDTFAELFDATHPSTEKEKGLVAAYWTQIIQSQPSFGSQTLNDALKDLGHGVGNITDALTALKEERPALLLQLKKSGASKQARKTYKLTQEGIRRVHTMISGDAAEE